MTSSLTEPSPSSSLSEQACLSALRATVLAMCRVATGGDPVGMMNDSNGSVSSIHESISLTSLSHSSVPIRDICSGSPSGGQEHSAPTSNNSC